MNTNEAYIILYKHDTYHGSSLKIWLKDGGKANIRKDHDVHDEASSFELFAPTNVEVVLCENHTYDGNYPGATGTWRGNSNRLQVNKGQLKDRGIHDNLSSLAWYLNGQLYNYDIYSAPKL
jgi:hypothetical protein